MICMNESGSDCRALLSSEGAEVERAFERTPWTVVVILGLVLFFGWQASANEFGGWTMELRAAANPVAHADIVGLANDAEGANVYRNGELVARWVPIAENKSDELQKNAGILTRQGQDGVPELLVLVGANDVTQDDVRRLYHEINSDGQIALRVDFNKESESKVFELTKGLVRLRDMTDGQAGYLAMIMDRQVYVVVGVSIAISSGCVINGVDENLIERIGERSGGLLTAHPRVPSGYSITVTTVDIVLFLAVILTIILGSLRAEGLGESKHPRIWIVCGIVVGVVVGAYQLGVSETFGSVGIGGGYSAIGRRIDISLLWGTIGGALGSVLGYVGGRLCRFFLRRAIYNLKRLILRGTVGST